MDQPFITVAYTIPSGYLSPMITSVTYESSHVYSVYSHTQIHLETGLKYIEWLLA